MAKKGKKGEEKSEVQKWEIVGDKGSFFGKTKSIFDNFLKMFSDGKNKNSECKL